MPIDLPLVRSLGPQLRPLKGKDSIEPSTLMQCLICGEMRPPVKRLAFEIKRIPGGQTSGMAIISPNVPAFESYGLKVSSLPQLPGSGERFSKAADELIENDRTHVTIGPLVYLCWTREEHGFFSLAPVNPRTRGSQGTPGLGTYRKAIRHGYR